MPRVERLMMLLAAAAEGASRHDYYAAILRYGALMLIY